MDTSQVMKYRVAAVIVTIVFLSTMCTSKLHERRETAAKLRRHLQLLHSEMGDEDDHFSSSASDEPIAHVALSMELPHESLGGRNRRSATNDGETGVRRNGMARQQQQQQQQQAASSGSQPTISKGTWMNRERNKQARLFLIQTQIMSSLRFSSRPNVTGRAHNLTDEEINAIHAQLSAASHGKADFEEPNGDDLDVDEFGELSTAAVGLRRRINHDARHQSTVVHRRRKHRRRGSQRTYVLLPTCTIPSRLKDSHFFSTNGGGHADQPRALRLYFSTDTLSIGGSSGTNRKFDSAQRGDSGTAVEVENANLRLYWRGQSNSRRKNLYSDSSVIDGTAANRENPSRSFTVESDLSKSERSRNSRRRPDTASEAESSSIPVGRDVRGLRGRGLRGRSFRRDVEAASNGPSVEIVVHQLSTMPYTGSRRRRYRDGDSKLASTPVGSFTLRHIAKSRWITFNVTSMVDEWIKNPSKNYGIQVMVVGKLGDVALTDGRGSQRRRQSHKSMFIDPFVVLDGIDCSEQHGLAEQNANFSGLNTSAGTDVESIQADPDQSKPGVGYPKLEVVVVRSSPPKVTSQSSSASGSQRRRKRNKNNSRRDKRSVDASEIAKQSFKCDLQRVNVSLDGFEWSQMVVHPQEFQFTYCESLNPCADSTAIGEEPELLADTECCEPVEKEPLVISYRDYVTGENKKFNLPNSNAVECRRRSYKNQ